MDINGTERDHVLTSKDKPPWADKLTPAIIAHREAFEAFVQNHAEPWHREHLGRLYAFWKEANKRYFAAAMVPPYILVSEPSNPRRFGDCGSVSGFGGLSQIRLRPSLFRKRGYDFVQDVLLHEMIHQWQQEVTGEREDQYFGHGPTFRDKANEIGAVLGLGRVRGSKKRGPDADRPNCCRWPHCVRGYPDAKRVNKPLEERAARMVRHLGNDSAREFARIILDVLTSKDR